MTTISSKLISFSNVLLFITMFISQSKSQQPTFSPLCSNDRGNYTLNSTYKNNLNTLLSNLISNTEITYGFYNFSYGQDTNKVYAIGLCRGDVNPHDCRNCLNSSKLFLTQNCTNQKEAIGWIDQCMLRYSDRSIFNLMETRPGLIFWNPNNATNVEAYNNILEKLVREIRDKAAKGDSRVKYATRNATSPDFQDIFGLMQCTPDLSSMKCDECLAWAIGLSSSNCVDKVGCRVIGPSCNIRYENYHFYENSIAEAPAPLPTLSPHTNTSLPAPAPGKGNTSRTVIVFVVAVPVVVVVALVFCCFMCIYLRVKKPRKIITSPSEEAEEIVTNESLQFNFHIIRLATNDFSDSNKLGQGGFGAVFWGKLSNGQLVAVKRLSMNSGQGDVEFKNEVLLVAKLQHRSLVRLLGFSIEGRERLLVYEFVPNKSLDYLIFDSTKKALLDWEKRYKIIGGIARGLQYLHEDSRLRIIHRDLKASNILLDEEMNAKISDFGMARLLGVDETQANTSKIAGTYGYMAPEYVMHGQFSIKSDVFSFGVLILEIVSGQKNRSIRHGENSEDLISFAWKSWMDGTATNIIDPSLYNSSRNEIMRCIHIGLLCVQENAANRPTMATIVLMLNSYSLTLPRPSEPAFFLDSRTRSLPNMSWEVNSRSTKSTRESINDVSITDPYPR